MNLLAAVSGLLMATGGLVLIASTFASTGLTEVDVITMLGGVLMYAGGLVVGWAIGSL